jgi:release factor glutamine methyltransferase
MSGTQYLASGDSALIRKVLRDYSGESALEIGAGNGGNLIDLADRFDLVVGTDIVRPGVADWQGKGAQFILADGATCLKDSAFDLIAFNPPYLRGEILDRAVDGGLDLEVPGKFMNEALRVVKPTGRIVFLLSHEADLDRFDRVCITKRFNVRRVAAERGFFEELSVYVAERH